MILCLVMKKYAITGIIVTAAKTANMEVNKIMKTVKTVTELLLEIRKRPGMYLGTRSMIRLRCYINGYIYAMKHEAGLDCGDRVFGISTSGSTKSMV